MKPKVKLRIVVGVVFTLLSFFSVPLVSVWKKSRVLEMVTANEHLKEKSRTLGSEILVLQYAAGRLQSRDRIETMAKNECGLVFPENRAVTVMVKAGEPGRRSIAPALFSAAGFIR